MRALVEQKAAEAKRGRDGRTHQQPRRKPTKKTPTRRRRTHTGAHALQHAPPSPSPSLSLLTPLSRSPLRSPHTPLHTKFPLPPGWLSPACAPLAALSLPPLAPRPYNPDRPAGSPRGWARSRGARVWSVGRSVGWSASGDAGGAAPPAPPPARVRERARR